jgi:hypothetical protein
MVQVGSYNAPNHDLKRQSHLNSLSAPAAAQGAMLYLTYSSSPPNSPEWKAYDLITLNRESEQVQMC